MSTIAEIIGTDITHEKDFVVANGDLTTVSGLDNIKAALLRRLVTEPGSVAYRPAYGVGLKTFQNSPADLSSQRALVLRIEEQFARETRIERVNSVEFDQSETRAGLLTIIVNVKIRGYGDEPFEFIPFGEVP